MIRDNKRLQYQFTDVEKASMIRICQKFPHYNDVQEIGNTLTTEGSTVLTVGQASILSGLVRPYYPPLADRLDNHPGIVEDQGVPQVLADGFED